MATVVAIGRVTGGPPGCTWVAANRQAVVQVQLGEGEDRFFQALTRRAFVPGGENSWVTPALKQLEEYYRGRRRVFQCKILLPKLSPFSSRVYKALRNTTHGSTITYGTLAKKAGSPRAARAVGRLMAANPIPIFIPCHRVVATSGLGGFGAGLNMKQKLLALETT